MRRLSYSTMIIRHSFRLLFLCHWLLQHPKRSRLRRLCSVTARRVRGCQETPKGASNFLSGTKRFSMILIRLISVPHGRKARSINCFSLCQNLRILVKSRVSLVVAKDKLSWSLRKLYVSLWRKVKLKNSSYNVLSLKGRRLCNCSCRWRKIRFEIYLSCID